MCPSNHIINVFTGPTTKCDVRLHEATSKGHIDVVEKCLREKACPNIRSKNGATVLHTAVQNSDVALVRLLLKHGAAATVTNGRQQTALHLAAIEGNTLVMDRLLRHGKCDSVLDATDVDGKSAMDYTKQHEHWHCEQMIIQHKHKRTEITRLIDAMNAGLTGYLEDYLQNGGCVNDRLRDGRTALHFAAETGQFQMCLKLLENGAFISVHDARRKTPFQLAYASHKSASDVTTCFRSFEVILMLIRFQCTMKRMFVNPNKTLFSYGDMQIIRRDAVLFGYYTFYQEQFYETIMQ